jgi:hypothetical protein
MAWAADRLSELHLARQTAALAISLVGDGETGLEKGLFTRYFSAVDVFNCPVWGRIPPGKFFWMSHWDLRCLSVARGNNSIERRLAFGTPPPCAVRRHEDWLGVAACLDAAVERCEMDRTRTAEKGARCVAIE